MPILMPPIRPPPLFLCAAAEACHPQRRLGAQDGCAQAARRGHARGLRCAHQQAAGAGAGRGVHGHRPVGPGAGGWASAGRHRREGSCRRILVWLSRRRKTLSRSVPRGLVKGLARLTLRWYRELAPHTGFTSLWVLRAAHDRRCFGPTKASTAVSQPFALSSSNRACSLCCGLPHASSSVCLRALIRYLPSPLLPLPHRPRRCWSPPRPSLRTPQGCRWRWHWATACTACGRTSAWG